MKTIEIKRKGFEVLDPASAPKTEGGSHEKFPRVLHYVCLR